MGRILRLSIMTESETQLHAAARGVLSIFPVVGAPQNQESWIGFRKEFETEAKSGFQWSCFNTDIKYESEERKKELKKGGKTHPQCECESSQKRDTLPCLYNSRTQDTAASEAIAFGGLLRNLNVMTGRFTRSI